MKTFTTRYGILKGVENATLYPDGSLKECSVGEESQLITIYGILTPQYDYGDYRKKHVYSASFYEDGALRRIYLNQQTLVPTPIGKMPAELITLYPGGTIKRIFPLNGQMSGYWDENDEYQLAKEQTLEFPFGTITAKMIAISFYESGKIRDLTLWPKERVILQTPVGKVRTHIGVALYPDGSIKSVEPVYATRIQTPIGAIAAYDINANGISGDRNSLVFHPNGALKSLITSNTIITVLKDGKPVEKFSPEQIIDEDGEEIYFQTIKLEFFQREVQINGGEGYDFSSHTFLMEPYLRVAQNPCENCSGCNQSCG